MSFTIAKEVDMQVTDGAGNVVRTEVCFQLIAFEETRVMAAHKAVWASQEEKYFGDVINVSDDDCDGDVRLRSMKLNDEQVCTLYLNTCIALRRLEPFTDEPAITLAQALH